MFSGNVSWRRHLAIGSAVHALALGLLVTGACVPIVPPGGDGDGTGEFNNTTDRTNRGASYIGAQACGACHPGISQQHNLHGHAHMLKRTEGVAPQFPQAADGAGVPQPPDGFDWSDIAYVIGGYTRKTQFLDKDGFILTTGQEGVPTQWNLSFPPNGTTAHFAAYEPTAETPTPYDFSCFQCHTTGPRPANEPSPPFQENRPGIRGTWAEAGVQCEACHGPGSNHIPNPGARDLFVGISAENCGKCHSRSEDPNDILAADGFIASYQQWPELLASGGHANFSCGTCHDPHSGTNYDRENAIRNECTACHADQTMAIHEGLIFVRGDYTEELSCVSCHMPFATRSATSATPGAVGNLGRAGDIRAHIFRINTDPVDYQSFFTPDGKAVAKENDGLAAVTMDFVCFRCHNGTGNAGVIDSLNLASGVAEGMHSISRPEAKR